MTVALKRIGVLVSGGGSNLQAIIDAVNQQELPANIAVVISNKSGVFALERAQNWRIPTLVIDHRQCSSSREFSLAILQRLQEFQIDLVCLAGFLRILDPLLIQEFRGRILNIHPALLPAFGGKGMYGHHVHEAVIASGAKFSGATVHLVTSETDIGPIVKQGMVTVSDEDTADSLAAKVLQIEHQIYPQAIKLVLEDKLIFDGCRTRLKKQ
ncbi:MAG TPA: phosphoribosylglycinamide formyltransferase [Firmicutes bacterium]|jgi:phosphoribosylglycinamide formyltransferase 1|nr:phosphoribosylglycinamide formyltransferase [Bacillota bacterium]